MNTGSGPFFWRKFRVKVLRQKKNWRGEIDFSAPKNLRKTLSSTGTDRIIHVKNRCQNSIPRVTGIQCQQHG
jgi:hypothetical protein